MRMRVRVGRWMLFRLLRPGREGGLEPEGCVENAARGLWLISGKGDPWSRLCQQLLGQESVWCGWRPQRHLPVSRQPWGCTQSRPPGKLGGWRRACALGDRSFWEGLLLDVEGSGATAALARKEYISRVGEGAWHLARGLSRRCQGSWLCDSETTSMMESWWEMRSPLPPQRTWWSPKMSTVALHSGQG